MSHVTEKGGRVPDAEDDLLDAWKTYGASVGVISQFASITVPWLVYAGEDSTQVNVHIPHVHFRAV